MRLVARFAARRCVRLFPRQLVVRFTVCCLLISFVGPAAIASVSRSMVRTASSLVLAAQGRSATTIARFGPPPGVLPNLDTMRAATNEARLRPVEVTAPEPIPSTRRRWRQAALEAAASPAQNAAIDVSILLAYAGVRFEGSEYRLGDESREAIWNSPLSLFPTPENRHAEADNTQTRLSLNKAAAASMVVSPIQGSPDFAMARLAAVNRTGAGGVDLLSRNFNWSVGLIDLPGRAGLDLGLGLSYNSLVWTRSGNDIGFDRDQGTPSPGFRIGFPVVQGLFYNDQAGANFYLLITPSGKRIELRHLSTNVYQTVDATYAQLIDNGSYLLFRSGGAELRFESGVNEFHCTKVKDRNGNYITISYNAAGNISNITDTLGRVITFRYDIYDNVTSITQTWSGQRHTWATFGYGLAPIASNPFPTLNTYGPVGTNITVLTQVGWHDGSRYNFEYENTYGIVSQIRHHAKDNHERRRTTYDLPSSSTDCPRVSAARDWAENWNGDINGTYAAGEEAVTQFGVDPDGACRMTLPNGVIHKEYYGSTWQAGLTTSTKSYANAADEATDSWKKRTTTAWTQENPGANYLLNPRVMETNIDDSEDNHKRVTIGYGLSGGLYESYSLPYEVVEYASNGLTPLRSTYYDYNLNAEYLTRRMIGLVMWVHVFDHVTGNFVTKTTYDYDDLTQIQATPATTIQHDAAFGTSFAWRGNVTSVSRWDVTDINNENNALTSRIGYDTNGSVVWSRDAATHQQNISYGDSFSDGINNRNTFAYPTTTTDADGFSSHVQYQFNFGAVTRTEGPPPGNPPQTQGAIQTMTYDGAGRIQWINNVNNGAWKFFTYADRGDAVMSQETINAAPPSYWSITVVDGADRVRLKGGDHPGSSGAYAGAFTLYDVMGQVTDQSNATETNSFWVPTGDDGQAGWIYTQQTYDWQGRPLVTTNQDDTTKEVSYGGCGCAGGSVVTLTDEVGRRQQIYSDVLGRTWKTEALNWNGTVYSATVNTYNARDQIKSVKQYQGEATTDGSCPTGTCQETTSTFDGHGRLKTRHVPEQDVGTNTVWDYYPDDTIQKVTDARGAASNFNYNARHLITTVSYDPPAGITDTADITYTYDAAGNRTSMSNGQGNASYQYDSLSRVISETRQLNGISFPLTYGYNLRGDLTSFTDSFGVSVGYTYDAAGRLSTVTGAGYGGVSQYVSSVEYRAWGGFKRMFYGTNPLSLQLSYNDRQQPTSYEVSGTTSQAAKLQYQYYDDGRPKYAQDELDARFDRAYQHDHLGRLTESYTGAEARDFVNGTNTGVVDGPYRQSYGHDSLSQMTSRTNRLWSGGFDGFSATYSNRRNTAWQYNADGKVTADWNKQYQYDAAGRNIFVSEAASYGLEITQSYDGDGLVTKRIEVHQGQYGTTTQTTYYLRSSVLGGAVVTELDEQGLKLKGNVYAGGQLLATQQFGAVLWSHRLPVSGSLRETASSGYVANQVEIDPLGANVGVGDPYVFYENPTYLDIAGPSLYNETGNPFDAGSGCTEIGMPMSCNDHGFNLRLWGSRISDLPGFGTNWGSFADLGIWEYERRVFLATVQVKEGGELIGGIPLSPDPNFSYALNQNPQNSKPDANAIRTGLKNALDKVKCSAIVNNLLNSVETKKNPRVQDDILGMFDSVVAGRGGLTRVPPPGSAGHGSPTGSLKKGNAGIFLEARQFGPEDQLQADIKGALGELMHLAGQNRYYTDRDFAEIVHRDFYKLTTSIWPGDPKDTYHKAAMKNPNNISWSYYWHNAVNRLCFSEGTE